LILSIFTPKSFQKTFNLLFTNKIFTVYLLKRLSCAVKRFCVTIRNSLDRALNRYENAHKTRKECVWAPACLAKSHQDVILTSREGLSDVTTIQSCGNERAPLRLPDWDLHPIKCGVHSGKSIFQARSAMTGIWNSEKRQRSSFYNVENFHIILWDSGWFLFFRIVCTTGLRRRSKETDGIF